MKNKNVMAKIVLSATGQPGDIGKCTLFWASIFCPHWAEPPKTLIFLLDNIVAGYLQDLPEFLKLLWITELGSCEKCAVGNGTSATGHAFYFHFSLFLTLLSVSNVKFCKFISFYEFQWVIRYLWSLNPPIIKKVTIFQKSC